MPALVAFVTGNSNCPSSSATFQPIFLLHNCQEISQNNSLVNGQGTLASEAGVNKE